jgi:hypothetical protein
MAAISQKFAEIYIIFGPALLANQIISNYFKCGLYIYRGRKSDIDIGTVLRQAIVLLNVAGAFYRTNNVLKQFSNNEEYVKYVQQIFGHIIYNH